MNIKHAFAGFSTDNLTKTKDFYDKVLGLEVEHDTEMDMLKIKLPNGGQVMVYPKPNHEASTYTVMNLIVDNIDKAVEELTNKGVKFEIYDGFDQDDKGISRGQGPLVAWFADPAGNIVSVIEA